MQETLNFGAIFQSVHDFQVIFTSTFYFLHSLVNKQSKDKAHCVRKDSDNCIGLIVDSELLCLVEEFVRLKDNIFTIKNSKCKNYGNDHTQCE